jgi:gliding motility-associated lipoprotein GldD
MRTNRYSARSYNGYVISFCILLSCSLFSCGGDEDDSMIAPKPRAYYRLTLPEKKYKEYDSIYPFKFEIPVYSKMEIRKGPDDKTGWLNLNFPSLNATINFTYKRLNGDVAENLDETYKYVSKHQIKSSGIEENVVSRDSAKVYGLIYEIGGNAASSIQFFLTDSTANFLRGALYFNALPNTDSIKPVLEFIRKDIYRMVETFEWKNPNSSPTISK